MACEKRKILSLGDGYSIIHFDCGHIGFRFGNMTLNFQPDDFLTFSSSFQKLNFEQRAVRFADGNIRIVINTCRPEIQLCFDATEFKTAKHALQEATIMLEVNDLIYPEQPK